MTSHFHSGLEVAPSTDLEVAPTTDQDTYKYPHYSGVPTDTDKIAYHNTAPAHDEPAPQTICGLQKRTFWIVIVVVVITVASAVGGAVGGALATRRSGETSETSSTRVPMTSMQPSSTAPLSTQTVSTTTIVGPAYSPQPTLLRDCPSSNDTLHSVTYGNTSYQFRKLCNGGYQNFGNLDSHVQGVVGSLDECIDMCAKYNQNNRTEIQTGRDPICNSVCWRNSFADTDWEGGHCFGFTTRNITMNGQTVFSVGKNGENCDSAALINQDF
jgi:hypothetical protein